MGGDMKKMITDFEKRKKPGKVIDYEQILAKAQTNLALQTANSAIVHKQELMKLKPGGMANFEPASAHLKFKKEGTALRMIHGHLVKKES